MSVDSNDVFHLCNNAINEAMRKQFGPAGAGEAPENISSMLAVALMSLSCRYFVATGAPKAVVADFFVKSMGMEDRTKIEEHKGKLRIVAPQPAHVKAVEKSRER